MLTTFIAVALVLVYVMAIVSALEVIIKARTAQGAVAWTISLLTLPYITVPLYLVFGRNKFDGYLEQRDQIEEESLRLIRKTSGMVAEHIVPVSNDTPLYASLFNLARMPATTGNKVDLLIDGQPAPGALVDFGLYLFHNARNLLERGTGPYFYLPKLESHKEAELWS